METNGITISTKSGDHAAPASTAKNQQVCVVVDDQRKSQFAAVAQKLEDHPVQQYIMGDCPGVSDWIDMHYPNYRWFFTLIESLLRTFGALVFVNNVWSGVLFLLAVLIHNAFAALVGILGIVTSYFMAMILNLHRSRLRNGVATFNGFMVGSYIAAVAMPVGGVTWNGWIIFPTIFFSILRDRVMIASILSTYNVSVLVALLNFARLNVRSPAIRVAIVIKRKLLLLTLINSTLFKAALHPLLQTLRLPALNLPFSITTLCFLASQGSTPAPLFPAQMFPLPYFGNCSIYQSYTAPGIIRGIFFSIGNIYECANVGSVCLAWIAVFLASPLLCAMCLLGSCVGTGIAIVLGVSAQQLYSGMWGFNSLLVCGSIGGFFYVWSVTVCVVAIFSAGLATVFAAGFYHVLGFVNLPFQALPLFVTDAIVMLALGAYSPQWFTRVEFRDIRYPELHRQLDRHVKQSKASTVAPEHSVDPDNRNKSTIN